MSDISAVRDDLADAVTVARACQKAADRLAGDAGASSIVLLGAHDMLRCEAASNTWWTHYTEPISVGAAGEAYTAGRTVVDYPVDPATSAYPVLPSTVMVACVPVRGPDREPVGVLKLEWPAPVEPIQWQAVAEPVAVALGERLAELRQPPPETVVDRLARHAVTIVACDADTLLAETLRTAREVSGLSTAVAIHVDADQRCNAVIETDDTGALAQAFRGLGQDELTEICESTHRDGPWYTRGEPADVPGSRSEVLPGIGARTAAAVPVGAAGGTQTRAGTAKRVLLVMDERTRPVTPAIVSLLELLGAQSTISQERLSLLESLHSQARHDPLTGLGHQIALGERMIRAQPGRTALLLIDVDKFREINDVSGHAAGDRLLVELAEAFQGVLRARDEVYRFGGDEFVVVVEVNRLAEARSIARRIMNAAHWVGCTVSVGVAMLGSDEAADGALRRADAAMHLAKREGRDRVEVATTSA